MKAEWFGNIRADVLAGIVVGLALIPEALVFAFIAGVDPRVALYASFEWSIIFCMDNEIYTIAFIISIIAVILALIVYRAKPLDEKNIINMLFSSRLSPFL